MADLCVDDALAGSSRGQYRRRQETVDDVELPTEQPREGAQSERLVGADATRREARVLEPARAGDGEGVASWCGAVTALDPAHDDLDLVAFLVQVPGEVGEVTLTTATDFIPVVRVDEGDAQGARGS